MEDKIRLGGMALVNGVNYSAGMLALGVYDASRLASIADIASTMTLEAMCGCTRALDVKVHRARGHAGQIQSAERMRELIEGSRLVESAGAVQDRSMTTGVPARGGRRTCGRCCGSAAETASGGRSSRTRTGGCCSRGRSSPNPA